MYAIILDGGRQYKVEEGLKLDIDLRSNVESGDEIEFTEVLAVGGDNGLKLGSPNVDGAKVKAKVISAEEKGEKIYVEKFRRRKNYHRRNGHRQRYTRVEIGKITG